MRKLTARRLVAASPPWLWVRRSLQSGTSRPWHATCRNEDMITSPLHVGSATARAIQRGANPSVGPLQNRSSAQADPHGKKNCCSRHQGRGAGTPIFMPFRRPASGGEETTDPKESSDEYLRSSIGNAPASFWHSPPLRAIVSGAADLPKTQKTSVVSHTLSASWVGDRALRTERLFAGETRRGTKASGHCRAQREKMTLEWHGMGELRGRSVRLPPSRREVSCRVCFFGHARSLLPS